MFLFLLHLGPFIFSTSPHNQLCFFSNRKQRRKLHDRLRQSLKNKRNKSSACNGHNQSSSTRGRPTSNLPLQDLQLVNVCCRFFFTPHQMVWSKSQQITLTEFTHICCCFPFLFMQQCNGTNMHAAEEESETTFSTTKYALAGHDATTFTHISSQR